MPGYKPQVKSENGDMVDIPIAATYDENGNKFNEQYVSIAAQTFTEEQKAQARANIGAVSAEEAAPTYYDHYLHFYHAIRSEEHIYMVVRTKDKTKFTRDSFKQWLIDRGFTCEQESSNITWGKLNLFFPRFITPSADNKSMSFSNNTIGYDLFAICYGVNYFGNGSGQFIFVGKSLTEETTSNVNNMVPHLYIRAGNTTMTDHVVGAYGEIVE